MSINNLHIYDILYLMLVSNSNNLLNILLPNDNKVLKEALKTADAQTLENIKKDSSNVTDVLKNLFDDLKTGDKNKNNIENILKNATLFKEQGSFSKSITTLLNQIETDPTLQKFKPALQAFLKDISNLDEKVLKDLIGKSGLFLESKALNQANSTTNLPKSLETILSQIKELLKNTPSLEVKKIENQINKILQNNVKTATNTQTTNLTNLQTQNNNDLKALITNLQEFSKGLSDKQLSTLTNLTNSLKNISSQAQLVESKIGNLPTTPQALNQQGVQISSLSAELSQVKQNILLQTTQTLNNLKSELIVNSKAIPEAQNLIKQIDTLLQSNDLFSKNNSLVEPKTLLNQLTNLNEIKLAANQNSNISPLVNSLKTQSETISTLENKLFQNINIQGEKLQLTQNIQQTLGSLRNELAMMKTIDTSVVNQIIDKLLNVQNLFSKIDFPLDLKNLQQNLLNQNSLNNFQNNFSSNLNTLILNLKENIINLSSNQGNLNLQNTILNSVEKLETIVNNLIQNQNLPIDKQLAQNSLQNDMKTVLLQMQNELAAKVDPASIESSKQVEKLIMQIEYHQLLSLASNSNNVYVPFFWNMLEEGTISMKKLDEEKFYCEINLSLKELGQTQLLLSLYDKNKLDLTIYASKNSFKESIKENLMNLKQSLNSVNLIPVNINIIDMKKDEDSKEVKQTNAFKQTTDLGFGVDIRV